MASKADDERRAFALSSGFGRNALVFAKHYGVNRTYLNMILSGKKPVGDAVAKALGLHKVYIAE